MRERLPLVLLMAAAFGMDMTIRGAGQAYQEAGLSLHASPLQLGLFGTVFAACYSVACSVAGRRSDRIGRWQSTLIAAAGLAVVFLFAGRVRNVALLLVLAGLGGVMLAFFWPAVQAWVGGLGDPAPGALARRLATFNVCWSVGIMCGPALTGYVWWMAPGGGSSQLFVFSTFAVLAALVGGICREAGARSPAPESTPARPPGVGQPVNRRRRRMLWAARAGLVAGYFGAGVIGSLFPKLAATLGYGERMRGLLVSSFHAGQVTLFGLALLTSGWQLRKWPLPLAAAAAAVAMASVCWAERPGHFAVAFAATGVASATAYAMSLFYSLHGLAEGQGRRTGIHEAILAGGVCLGPLLGGVVAEHISLRAPFALAATVFLIALGAQWIVWGTGTKWRDDGG